MIVTTNFYVQSNLQKRKIDGIQYQYIAFDTYMNAAQMWAKESEKTPTLLKFCQAAFNLWELNMRKATMEYNTQPSMGMEPVMDYYRSLYSRQYEQYRRITQNGRLEAEVEKMDKEVEAELSRNVFDPVQYVGMLRLAKGGGASLGWETHMPFSEYLGSPMFGFDLGFQFFRKRRMFGMDIDMEFGGKCHKDIACSQGTIRRDEKLMGGSIRAYYGLNVKHGRRVDITPFLGAGVRFYDGGTKDHEYRRDKGRNKLEKAGPTIGVGCLLDYALKRQFFIKVGDDVVSEHRMVLRMKPFVSFTHFSGEMGWVPALNVAVEYGAVFRSMK